MKYKRLIIICILMLAILSGCAKESDSKNLEWEELDEKEEKSWDISHQKLSKRYTVASISGDYIIGAYADERGVVITSEKIGGNGETKECVIDEATEVESITADEVGNIYALGFSQENPMLWKLDKDNNVSEINNTEMESADDCLTIRGFYKKGDYCYLWVQMQILCSEVYENAEEGVYTLDDRIYVKDLNMNTVCYDDIPSSYGNQMICFMFDEKDNPIVLAQDEEGYYKRNLKISLGSTPEKERIKENIDIVDGFTGVCNNVLSTEDGLMYTKKGDINKYSLGEGKSKRIIHLAGAGINEDDIISWIAKDGEIRILDNYKESANTELTTIKEGKSEKKTIRIAVAGITEDVRNVITSFNRNQNKIQLEPVEYVNDYDYDVGIDALQKDILQGKAPDIFITTGLDYEVFVHAGVFEDLYKYFDSDPEFGRNCIVPSVLKANELDGKIYIMSPEFSIFTMWGGHSTAKGKTGINMDEAMSLLSNAGGDINCIYGLESADESKLRTLTSMELDSYIDWDKCECNFENESFYNLLELAKEYRGCYINDSLSSAMRSKRILMTCGTISSVEDYCLQKALYGEEIDITGYPTDEGFGSAIELMDSVAMNAKSENKEEAWEFIKYYIKGEDENQFFRFPTYVKNYEKKLESSMEEELITNEDGVSEKVAKTSYQDKDCEPIFVFKAEQQDVDVIRNLIEKTTKKYEYVNEIQNIIEEEAGAYLENQKSVEDVSEIIQSRITMYLQESVD